jgi:hypothetical protein
VVVDRDRIEDRIDRIRRYTRDLRDFSNISREAFRGHADISGQLPSWSLIESDRAKRVFEKILGRR